MRASASATSAPILPAPTTPQWRWYRKGYRGSSNDDIWICDADGSNNRQLTNFAGQDNSPMWSADGKWLYYVSDGTVARQHRHALGCRRPGKRAGAVTQHKDDAVRRARISGNGEWIVYECGPDLWVHRHVKEGKSRKLKIEVNADDKSNPERSRRSPPARPNSPGRRTRSTSPSSSTARSS